MFFCYPLSSGSKGNCYLFSDGISSLFIDCGIGPRVIKRNIDNEIARLQQNISELQRQIDTKNQILIEKNQNTSYTSYIPQETSTATSEVPSKTYNTFEEFIKHISIDLDVQNSNLQNSNITTIHQIPNTHINQTILELEKNTAFQDSILERELQNQKKLLHIFQNLTIDAVFISHAHTDHIGGCCSLEKSFRTGKLAKPNPSKNKDLNIPFYMSTGTVLESQKIHLPDNYKIIEDGSIIQVGDLIVEAFDVPHDAPETLAFRVGNGKHWAGVVTDLGYVPPKIIDKMRTMTFLALEFNYDEHMLQMGSYPYYLKDRIRGNLGHLSNEQAERVLMEVASPTLHDVVLAHISQNNNTPAIAYKHASQALWKSGFHEDIHIHYTKQKTPLYPIIIGDQCHVKDSLEKNNIRTSEYFISKRDYHST